MGAAIGSALRPRAGAVIWACGGPQPGDVQAGGAGRSRRRAGHGRRRPAVRRDRLGVPAARRASGRRRGRCGPRPGPGGRIPVYVDANAVSPATVQAIAARLGPTTSSTGRSSGRRRGSPATRCCGCPGRRPRTSRSCSPGRRSPRGSWAPSWAPRVPSRRVSRCRARRCRRSGWRWPPPPAATASRTRCAASSTGWGSTSARSWPARRAGRRRRGAGRGDGRGGRHRGRRGPSGRVQPRAAELYRRLSDGRLAP